MTLSLTARQGALLQLALVLGLPLATLIGLQGPLVTLYALGWLGLLPGWLYAQAAGWHLPPGPRHWLYMAGLSLSSGLVTGLATNSLLTWLGQPRPLDQPIVAAALCLPLLAALGYTWFRRRAALAITTTFHRPAEPGLILCAPLLPLLASLGATSLNNNGTAAFTAGFVMAASAYGVWLVSRHRRLSDGHYAWAIFWLGLGLLLMTSLRSWHVSGYDIHQEYQVFELTLGPLQWSMSHLRDPYNACLSITIWPTIVSQLAGVAPEYVYKLVFQIWFALMPVGLFVFARFYASQLLSFLAAAFVMTQVWFFQGMPTLIRQEFALLSFTILLVAIFDRQLAPTMRRALIVAMGAAMVLSHYSTTYVAIALLLVAWSIHRAATSQAFSTWTARWRPTSATLPISHLSYLRLWHIGLLVGFATLWNFGFTHTTGGVARFVDHSATNFGQVFSLDTIVGAVRQTLFPYPSHITIDTYLKATVEPFRAAHPEFRYYTAAEMAGYQPALTGFAAAPPRLGPIGEGLASLAFKGLKVTLNNVFIVVGLAVVYRRWQQGRFGTGEYPVLVAAGFVLLLLLLLLPAALKEYNLERLYFQQLITWAPVGVLGGVACLGWWRSGIWRFYTLGALYVAQLWLYSGVVFALTGGPALITLNNYGEDYDKFVTHDSEIAAARWLGDTHANVKIYSGSPGRNQLWAYGQIPGTDIITETLPAVIDRDSYVYLTRLNTAGGRALFQYGNDEYAYTGPQAFLEAHKNLLYTSGETKIYR